MDSDVFQTEIGRRLHVYAVSKRCSEEPGDALYEWLTGADEGTIIEEFQTREVKPALRRVSPEALTDGMLENVVTTGQEYMNQRVRKLYSD